MSRAKDIELTNIHTHTLAASQSHMQPTLAELAQGPRMGLLRLGSAVARVLGRSTCPQRTEPYESFTFHHAPYPFHVNTICCHAVLGRNPCHDGAGKKRGQWGHLGSRTCSVVATY